MVRWKYNFKVFDIFLLFISLILLSGCAIHKKQKLSDNMDYSSLEDYKKQSPSSPGSIWVKGSEGLFADNKASKKGDILTVAIYEQASASKQAKTNTERDSSNSAGIGSFFGLEAELGKLNDTINPAQLVDTDYNSVFKGSGSTVRQEKLTATLTTRVTEVLPNGILKIKGSKRVKVNNEEQIIQLTGMVRPEDITAENMVDSQYILNAQIDYTGHGVLSDKQRPGWLVRLMDNVWPF